MPYHSFPRRVQGPMPAVDKGLAILRSMASMGLVLTPEQTQWTELLTDGTQSSPRTLSQKRTSFTDIGESELSDHSATFGPFTLEFGYENLRRLGGLPVFYLPLGLSEEEGFDGLGGAMLMRLGEIQLLLERLGELHDAAESAPPDETLRVDHPNGAFTVIGAAATKTLLDILTAGIQPYEVLVSNLRGLSGMFYPIEDLDYTELLGYYRQREWRIIANMEFQGEPVTRELADDEKSVLLSIDIDFFGREEDFRSGRYRIVDQCRVMPSLAGRHLLAYAERLFVPEGSRNDAEDILSDAGIEVPVREVLLG